MHTFIAPLFSFSLALLQGAGYVSIGGHSGVEVFQKKDSPGIELATVGEIAATPAEVQAVLLDYAHHPRYTPRLTESRVLEKRDGELYVYEHLKLPVINDRDYTLHVTWNPGEPRGIQFSVENSHGPKPRAGAVRMTTLIGRWDLEPIQGGKATRATYRVQIDFAGSVPRWMVRGGAAKELPGLYDGIRFEAAVRRLQTPNGVSTASR
ncbi:MAG TPA: SRPBCC family protein [Polyangia bacterium]|nr:SRPBCC family protein [Polyangia bacterium]